MILNLLQETCFGVIRRELEHSSDDILPVKFNSVFFLLISLQISLCFFLSYFEQGKDD